MNKKVFIQYDDSYLIDLWDDFKIEAKKYNIDLTITNKININEINKNDVVISHDNRINNCQAIISIGGVHFNRDKSLKILEENNFDVVKWSINPYDIEDNVILLKKSIFYRAKEIYIINKKTTNPYLNYTHGDIYCEILEEDFNTYKIHVLYDTIIYEYYIETPNILHGKFDITKCNKKYFEFPEIIKKKSTNLGIELFKKYNIGEFSIDFMKKNNRFIAIEINTGNTAINRKLLDTTKSKYIYNYIKGISNIVNMKKYNDNKFIKL